MKRRILSALCAFALLGVLAVTTCAAQVPDFDRKGSISIDMTYQGSKVPGGTLTLYRVADVVERNGDYLFQYCEPFTDCTVSVDDPSTVRIALALSMIAAEKQVEGSTKAIDGQGHVIFEDLTIGLYLLVQHSPAPGYNTVSPFLVSVPGNEDGVYIYDVNASPKVALEPKPTEPPTETTKPPSIPQTGQVNWPVPVMAAAGLLFLLGGWMMVSSAKRK